MSKAMEKKQIEDMIHCARVKKFRAKSCPGYFKNGELHRTHLWHATLGGQVVSVSQKEFGIRFCEEAAAYYTWEDAKKAAYIFRDKCRDKLKELGISYEH